MTPVVHFAPSAYEKKKKLLIRYEFLVHRGVGKGEAIFTTIIAIYGYNGHPIIPCMVKIDCEYLFGSPLPLHIPLIYNADLLLLVIKSRYCTILGIELFVLITAF